MLAIIFRTAIGRVVDGGGLPMTKHCLRWFIHGHRVARRKCVGDVLTDYGKQCKSNPDFSEANIHE